MGGCCGRPTTGLTNLIIQVHGHSNMYAPGDEVRGVVIMELDEPIMAHYVKITFVGEARNNWEESYVGANPKRGKVSINCEASEVYVNEYITLWKPAHGRSLGAIPTGKHRMAFRFRLPENCASSFYGTRGHIRYELNVRVGRRWFRCDNKYSRVIKVCRPSDCSNISNSPLYYKNTTNIGFLHRSGQINLTLNLPKGRTVCITEEPFAVEMGIVNDTSKHIEKVTISLTQHSHYLAHILGNSRFALHSEDSERNLVLFTEKVDIGGGVTEKMTRFLRIPPVVATFKIPIITVEYFLNVTFSTLGFIKTNAFIKVPITIVTSSTRSIPRDFVNALVKPATLYDVLEVQPRSTAEQIKKSFRNLAMKYHPDKKPTNPEKFKTISNAYDILSNPEMRAVYDEGGIAAVEKANNK